MVRSERLEPSTEPGARPASRPVYIWGAGQAGRAAARGVGRGLVAFIDSSSAKWGAVIDGHPVQPPGRLLEDRARGLQPFTVVASMHWAAIEAALVGMGFERGRDFATTRDPAAPLARDQRPGEVFSTIYADNAWGSTVSRSGNGSSLEATRAIRHRIPALVAELGVHALLDAPCGDFAWMGEVARAVPCYIGVDVVPALVAQNEAAHGSDRVRFSVADVITDPLPAADLIVCRDCLVHLTLAQALEALRNLQRSGARYLLTTTFPACDVNQDVPTGAWRPLNLERAPFCLPAPRTLINEDCREGGGEFADKSLGLWTLQELQFLAFPGHAR